MRQYSVEELRAIEKKIKPTKVETENIRLHKIETDIKELYKLISKSVLIVYPDLNFLKNELIKINDRVEKLEREEVEEIINNRFSPDETIRLVSKYLKEKSEAFPSDIADALGVSIIDVMDAIKILQEEKKIGEV